MELETGTKLWKPFSPCYSSPASLSEWSGCSSRCCAPACAMLKLEKLSVNRRQLTVFKYFIRPFLVRLSQAISRLKIVWETNSKRRKRKLHEVPYKAAPAYQNYFTCYYATRFSL